MAQPILSVERTDPKPKAAVNLLPCRVYHDGPVGPVDSFWNPSKAQDGINVTYFRGRKLHGRAIALPERYQGAVVERAAIDEKQHKATAPSLEDGDDQEINESETATMLVTAEFDEIMIWGHEEMADAHEDMYVRGVEEWVQVAEKIHQYGHKDSNTPK